MKNPYYYGKIASYSNDKDKGTTPHEKAKKAIFHSLAPEFYGFIHGLPKSPHHASWYNRLKYEWNVSMAIATPGTLVDILTDFLAANPSSEEIVAFRLPEHIEQRAHELLELNRQNRLNDADRADFEEFMRMEQFMSLLKIKARLQLSKNA